MFDNYDYDRHQNMTVLEVGHLKLEVREAMCRAAC